MYKNPEKLKEYKQRQKEWRDISVTQLSNVNNILITLSTGFLVLGIKPDANKTNFSCAEKLSFILLVLSICWGIGVLFSRLYDFRISRHLALCRQRFYKERCEKLPDNYLDKSDYMDRIKIFWGTILRKIDFINQREIKTGAAQNIKERFNKLRKKADVLGEATWIWTKYQVLFFLMGAGLYFITQLFKF